MRIYHVSVLKSLGRHPYISRIGIPRPHPLPHKRFWRFIRRTNDYLLSFTYFDETCFPTPYTLWTESASSGVTLYHLIERTRLIFKSHRYTGEQQFDFTTSDDPNDQVTGDDDIRCGRYLIQDRYVVTYLYMIKWISFYHHCLNNIHIHELVQILFCIILIHVIDTMIYKYFIILPYYLM